MASFIIKDQNKIVQRLKKNYNQHGQEEKVTGVSLGKYAGK